MYHLDFDESTHTYTLDGEVIPSVTQFLKSYAHEFDPDEHAGRIAERTNSTAEAVKKGWKDKGEAAADQGTDIHAVAESLAFQASAGQVTIDPAWRSHSLAAGRFFQDHAELLGSPDLFPEQRLVHPEYKVAGTCDLIAPLDGICTVVDWKAVQRIEVLGFGSKFMYSPANKIVDSNYWHYALQLNIYRVILIDYYQADQHPEKMVLVHLRSDGKYDQYDVPLMEDLTRKLLEKGVRKKKCSR